ncbi:MAG TPA: hypothetical protein VGM65_03490 [Candidatus Udaeobacter sp.]
MRETTIDTMDTGTATLSTTRPTNVHDPHVIVRGSGRGFLQEISTGNHWFQADEPVNVGGDATQPRTRTII